MPQDAPPNGSASEAGVLTETGKKEGTWTGTPQGGILSPLLANVAPAVLDEHAHGP